MPNNNYFAQLSPEQKAELFSIYVNAGYKTLSSIRDHYNSEMSRAYSSTEKDMVSRMRDTNAPYLLDENGNKMTHMMASGDGYVFPTIQRNDNGDLENYGNTEDWGAQRAIDMNDTLQFRLPGLAEYFSRNYKTHLDNPTMHAYGGSNGDGFFNRMLGKVKQAFGIVSLPENTQGSGYNWTEDDVKNLAKAFENREPKAYIGVKGDVLGGYGHKLTDDEIAKYWNRKTGKAIGTIEDSVIDGWLDSDMGKAFKSVERYYGKGLPSNIWAALSSLSFQGGDLLIRGKRDSNNQIRKDWSGGSPLFEEAVKKYLDDKTDANMQGIIDQMQYRDDGNSRLSGLSSRYGLYRAMIDNTADPSKIYEYKNDGTYKLYKSNKKKN